MDIINKGEIVFCNITLSYLESLKLKNIKLDRVVFSRSYISNYPNLDINDSIVFKIKSKIKSKVKCIISDVKVVDLHIIARTGYKHKLKGFTEVSKNNEVRNKNSGAYE